MVESLVAYLRGNDSRIIPPSFDGLKRLEAMYESSVDLLQPVNRTPHRRKVVPMRDRLLVSFLKGKGDNFNWRVFKSIEMIDTKKFKSQFLEDKLPAKDDS